MSPAGQDLVNRIAEIDEETHLFVLNDPGWVDAAHEAMPFVIEKGLVSGGFLLAATVESKPSYLVILKQHMEQQ